jgi:O-acetyl-ADP-ribose deacetylase
MHPPGRRPVEGSESVRTELGTVVLELTRGDIARQEGFDAVVNAANAHLRPGGGVAGALHRAAGPGLAEEGRPLAPISPGQAVITSGHNLPNPWVIHCLGPVYGQDRPEDLLLSSCYREALRIAEQRGLRSAAFPALSTGIFGYPMEEAARVALGTVLGLIPELKSVRHIRFVLYDERAVRVHAEALGELVGE